MGFFDKLYNGATDVISGPVDFIADGFQAGQALATEGPNEALGVMINSFQEEILGQTMGGLFGPEGIGGAFVGAVPEPIRNVGRNVIDPVFGAWDWAVQEIVDRPLGTLFTVVNATAVNGFDNLFDLETYSRAWEINDARTFGQSLAAYQYRIDPFDEDEYNAIQDDPLFNLISGTADFIQEFADPVTIVTGGTLKAARGGAVAGRVATGPRRGSLIGRPQDITRVYGGGTGIRPRAILGERFRYLTKTDEQLAARERIIQSHTQQRGQAFLESEDYARIESTMSKLDSVDDRFNAFKQVTGKASKRMSDDAILLFANAETAAARTRTMRALIGDVRVLEEVAGEAKRLREIMQGDNWNEIAKALYDPKFGDAVGAAKFRELAEQTDWAVMSQFREALFKSQQVYLDFDNGLNRYLGTQKVTTFAEHAAEHIDETLAALESVAGAGKDIYGSVLGMAQTPWGSRLDGILRRHAEVLEQRGDKYVVSEFANPHTVGGAMGGVYGRAVRVLTERVPQAIIFFTESTAVRQFERVMTQATRVNVNGQTILDAQEAGRLTGSFQQLKMQNDVAGMSVLYENTVRTLNSRLDDLLRDSGIAGIDKTKRALTDSYNEQQVAWMTESANARTIGVTEEGADFTVTVRRQGEDGATYVLHHRMSPSQVKSSMVQPRYDLVQRQIELAQARAGVGAKFVAVTVGDVTRGAMKRIRPLLDTPQQAWRHGMLLRPAWPMRVGIDEQLRAMADMGALTGLGNLVSSFPELRRAYALHKLDGIDEATDVEALSRILREQTSVRTVSDQLDEITARLDEQLEEYGRIADMPDAVKAEREQLKQQQKVLLEQGDATQRDAARVSASASPDKPIESPVTDATIQAFGKAGGRWDFENLSLEEQIEWHEAHGAGLNEPSAKYQTEDLDEFITNTRELAEKAATADQRATLAWAPGFGEVPAEIVREVAAGKQLLEYLDNTSPAQIETQAIRAFRNVINDPDTRLVVALPDEAAERFKEMGTYKTVFDSDAIEVSSRQDIRQEYQVGLGIPADLPAELRPASTALVPGAYVRAVRQKLEEIFEASFDELSEEAREQWLKRELEAFDSMGLDVFGKNIFLLDPSVLERSKFTYGNSLSRRGNFAGFQNASDQAILDMVFGRAGTALMEGQEAATRAAVNQVLIALASGNPERFLGLQNIRKPLSILLDPPTKIVEELFTANDRALFAIGGSSGQYMEAFVYGRFTFDEIAATDVVTAGKLGLEQRSMFAPPPAASLSPRSSSLSLFELYELAGPEGLRDAVKQLSREKVLAYRNQTGRRSNLRRLGRNAALKGGGVGLFMGNPVLGAVYGVASAMSKRARINQALERKAALNYAGALRNEAELMLRQITDADGGDLAAIRKLQDDASYLEELVQREVDGASDVRNAFDAAEELMQQAGVGGVHIGGVAFRNAFGDDPRYQEQIRAGVSASRSQSAVYSGARANAQRQLERYQDVNWRVFDALEDGDISNQWERMMNQYTSRDIDQKFYQVVWSNDDVVVRKQNLTELLENDEQLLRSLSNTPSGSIVEGGIEEMAGRIIDEYETVLPSGQFADLRLRAQAGEIVPWSAVKDSLLSPDAGFDAGKSLNQRIQETRDAGYDNFAKATSPEPLSHTSSTRRLLNGRGAEFFEDLFKMLGTFPTDELARNPAFRVKYERELRRRVELMADEDGMVRLSQRNINEIEQQARESALFEVRELMYDLAEDTRISEMIGNAMPFFNAWQEVIGRWAGLAVQNPTFVGNAIRIYKKPWEAETLGITEVTTEDAEGNVTGTYLAFRPFGPAFDEEGNETTIFEALSPAMRNLLIPESLRDQNATVRFSKDGLNTVMQAPVPGFGPLITIPVREAILEDPSLEETFNFMFPFGHPEGGFFQRALVANLPTWQQSLINYRSESQSKERIVQRMFQDIVVERADAGEPLDWNNDLEVNAAIELANDRAKDFFIFRAAAGLFAPTSTTLLSPYEPLVQEARKLQREHGTLIGNDIFLEKYGEDFYALTARMTRLNDGVAASVDAEELYMQHQELVQAHPEVGAWITNSVGATDEQLTFSQAVYRKQQEEQLAPGSDQNRRERKTPLEAIGDTQADLGWREYTELRDFVRTKQEEAIALGMSGNLNSAHMEPVRLFQEQQKAELALKYPQWAEQERDFTRSARRMKAVVEGFAAGLQDPQLLQRPSSVHLIEYFEYRMFVQRQLQARDAAGGTDDITSSSNTDLQLFWEQKKQELSFRPEFSALYDRFFERDNLYSESFVADDAFEGLL